MKSKIPTIARKTPLGGPFSVALPLGMGKLWANYKKGQKMRQKLLIDIQGDDCYRTLTIILLGVL